MDENFKDSMEFIISFLDDKMNLMQEQLERDGYCYANNVNTELFKNIIDEPYKI